MDDKDKKKIYEAARMVCLMAVDGFDAEIDYDNLEEIVDKELITVIDNISHPTWIPTDKHIRRLENLIELVEDEYGEYDDNLCEELLEHIKQLRH
jgi:hypothetical protein